MLVEIMTRFESYEQKDMFLGPSFFYFKIADNMTYPNVLGTELSAYKSNLTLWFRMGRQALPLTSRCSLQN